MKTTIALLSAALIASGGMASAQSANAAPVAKTKGANAQTGGATGRARTGSGARQQRRQQHRDHHDNLRNPLRATPNSPAAATPQANREGCGGFPLSGSRLSADNVLPLGPRISLLALRKARPTVF